MAGDEIARDLVSGDGCQLKAKLDSTRPLDHNKVLDEILKQAGSIGPISAASPISRIEAHTLSEPPPPPGFNFERDRNNPAITSTEFTELTVERPGDKKPLYWERIGPDGNILKNGCSNIGKQGNAAGTIETTKP